MVQFYIHESRFNHLVKPNIFPIEISENKTSFCHSEQLEPNVEILSSVTLFNGKQKPVIIENQNNILFCFQFGNILSKLMLLDLINNSKKIELERPIQIDIDSIFQNIASNAVNAEGNS